MPRTSLAWRLFAGWCSLVAALLVGWYWLASLELAGFAPPGMVTGKARRARARRLDFSPEPVN